MKQLPLEVYRIDMKYIRQIAGYHKKHQSFDDFGIITKKVPRTIRLESGRNGKSDVK